MTESPLPIMTVYEAERLRRQWILESFGRPLGQKLRQVWPGSHVAVEMIECGTLVIMLTVGDSILTEDYPPQGDRTPLMWTVVAKREPMDKIIEHNARRISHRMVAHRL